MHATESSSAFGNPPDEESIRTYLAELRENWRPLSSDLNRTLGLMLLLMAVFELIVQAKITGLSISGFEIEDLALIQIAMPPVVAFLFYQYNHIVASWNRIDSAHSSILKEFQVEMEKSGLVVYLEPRIPASLGYYWPSSKSTAGLTRVLGLVIIATTGVLATGFQVYAYVRQIQSFGLSDWRVWIAFGLSVFLTLFSFVLARVAKTGTVMQQPE